MPCDFIPENLVVRFRAQKSAPAELVDALDLVLSKQTYTRAVHTKEIVLEGGLLPSSVATT